ncbi:hypothetical protein PCIT_a3561 [Pseudoalteromonas citrea]|uniref:Gamma-butyrobetaine hydroxylase-like N-terminal domain-containing protein n=2 Tax=Pseudoalteromonas citrea TaxID=43655 RepID=A0AAD4FR76_9GAMM|nr:gamma-butyrobetaine hydroxylase-like domain-containing protein [Pseudoalteromonas citrea]KAF7769020.1 hypothetical protein PCIT_a3561 [Pseudoalteromonas citrea]
MYLVTKLHLHRKSNILDVHFDDDMIYSLSCEYLRTHSPSAEVQGHGAEQSKLVLNKHAVAITTLEPVGHYAVRLSFDDGHNSGLFSWQYLRELGVNHTTYWQTYSDRVAQHNKHAHSVPIKFMP